MLTFALFYSYLPRGPYVGGLLKKGHQDHEKETALRQVLESKLQIRAGDVPVEMLRSWDVPESST